MAHSPPQQRRKEPTNNAAPASRQAASGTNAARKTSAQSGTSSKSASSKDKGDPKMIGPWRIGRTIGKGSSGRVKIAKHVHTSQLAAVKIVPKHALLSSRLSINEAGAKADKLLLGIEREIVIMKLIEHPSVLRLFDVWETGSELYLVMEYVEGGELFDYLVSRGRLHADEALHYFQQIIAGVDYCHRFNICHRDLKPENLLLDRDRNIKIADFGMAALERNDKLLETSCGSPHYASPEIVSGLTYHGSSSDIWSCGIILFALLTGRLPFDDENIRNLLAKVKLGRFNMPQELPTDAKDLIRKMLDVDPTKRITMEGIVAHPWFTRRAPRPVGDVVAPPTPDQMERPIGTKDELDPDILSNLKTLWHGTSEAEIVKTLTSNTKSWQKVFYILLLRYRTKHLENFNMEEEEEAPQRRPSQRRQIENTGSVSAREEKPARPTVAPKVNYPAQVARPAPPVPAASVRAAPSSPRPLPQAPSPVKGRETPRKPIPSIILQEASPYYAEPETTRASRPTSVASSTATSPVLPIGSFAPPGSPTPSIQIPDMGNEAMQRFFHDIVDQLQTISTRPSPTLPFPSPALSDRSSFASSTYTQSPSDVDDGNQFEDAEEEATSSPTMASPPVLAAQQPFGEIRSAGASAIVPGRLSLRNPPRPAVSRPGPRPNSAFAAMSAPAVPARSTYPSSEVADKENTAGSRRIPGSNAKPTLGLALQAPGGGQMDIFGPEGVSNGRVVNKKKEPASQATQVMASPIMSMSSNSSSSATKGSWFASLFNWKQLTFALQSCERPDITRAECKRLLEALGAQVIVESADRSAILKCRMDEMREYSSSTPLKPVRFKVEFTSQNSAGNPLMSPASPRNGANMCTATLIMEKGAHSTFKAVSSQLKRHWRLDQQSPSLGYGNMR